MLNWASRYFTFESVNSWQRSGTTGANRTPSYLTAWNGATSEAKTFVALICPDRAARLAASHQSCPPITDDMKPMRPVALAEIKAAENFSAVVAAAVKAQAAQQAAPAKAP